MAANALYKECMTEILRLDKHTEKDYLLDKIRTFQVTVTAMATWKFIMVIGSGPTSTVVCR